jgi:hypothetical protein
MLLQIQTTRIVTITDDDQTNCCHCVEEWLNDNPTLMWVHEQLEKCSYI